MSNSDLNIPWLSYPSCAAICCNDKTDGYWLLYNILLHRKCMIVKKKRKFVVAAARVNPPFLLPTPSSSDIMNYRHLDFIIIHGTAMITSVHRQPFIGRRLNRRTLNNDSCSCGSRRVSTRKMWCKYTLIYRINFVVWPNQRTRIISTDNIALYIVISRRLIFWCTVYLRHFLRQFDVHQQSSCNSSSVYNNYYAWQCIRARAKYFYFV